MERGDSIEVAAAMRIHWICKKIEKAGPTTQDLTDLIAATDEFIAGLEKPEKGTLT
ncbi:MAG: hypothetical protein HPY55_07095 [Firmicutes bacterium]|nr:hypothetical protein [Bacillota bacterium]